MKSKNRQAGYMVEVPLLLLAVALVLSILVPKLPIVIGKIVVVAGALAWIGGLYYMIVVPGWRPGSSPRMGRFWRLAVFFVVSGLLIFGVGAYVVRA